MDSGLEEEIESRKGLSWTLRREDRDPWDRMIEEIGVSRRSPRFYGFLHEDDWLTRRAGKHD